MTFTNIDPNIDVFTQNNMLIGYKDLISTAFLQKIAKNTSYNYNNTLSSCIFENEGLGAGATKDYDAGKTWANKYVEIIVNGEDDVAGLPLPQFVDTHAAAPEPLNPARYRQLTTTTWVEFTVGRTDVAEWAVLQIIALAAGGFRIYNPHATSAIYYTGSIKQIRKVTGVAITP